MALNSVKLAQFRRLSTELIKSSLQPGQAGPAEGLGPMERCSMVITRLSILVERAEDIHSLPREIMEKENRED